MSYCYEFRHFACGQCGSVLVLFDLWFVVHNWVLVIALPVFIGGYYRGVGVHLIDVCRCFFLCLIFVCFLWVRFLFVLVLFYWVLG